MTRKDQILILNNLAISMEQLPLIYEGRMSTEEYINVKTALTLAVKSARWLDEIEKKVRKAFADPDTENITLHRAQVLADILAIFEYNGATIWKEAQEDGN